MHHVERRDPISGIAPDHRALFGIRDRKLPHCGIQVWNSHADHTVLAVALGKCFAENAVERADFPDADALGNFGDPGMPPVASKRHHAPAPAPAPVLSAYSSLNLRRALGDPSAAGGSISSPRTTSSFSVWVTIEQP